MAIIMSMQAHPILFHPGSTHIHHRIHTHPLKPIRSQWDPYPSRGPIPTPINGSLPHRVVVGFPAGRVLLPFCPLLLQTPFYHFTAKLALAFTVLLAIPGAAADRERGRLGAAQVVEEEREALPQPRCDGAAVFRLPRDLGCRRAPVLESRNCLL